MKNAGRNNIFSADINLREIADHRLNGMSCISYVDVYENSSYHPHWHDEFEAVYVKKGSIKMYINNGEYLLNEGDGAFINSCIVHNYESGTPIITGYLRSQMPILRCLCRTASQDYVVLFCFFGVRLYPSNLALLYPSNLPLLPAAPLL